MSAAAVRLTQTTKKTAAFLLCKNSLQSDACRQRKCHDTGGGCDRGKNTAFVCKKWNLSLSMSLQVAAYLQMATSISFHGRRHPHSLYKHDQGLSITYDGCCRDEPVCMYL